MAKRRRARPLPTERKKGTTLSDHETGLSDDQLAEFVGAGAKALALIANRLGPKLTHHWSRNNEAMQRVFLTALCPPPQDMKAPAEATVPQPRSAPHGEPSLDTICVDRSILPAYPNWVKMVMHPDLEATGPGKYGLATIEPWLHDGQRNGGRVAGNRIYEHLQENNLLDSCLGLRDGEEIQRKGAAVFRKFFGDNALFLWKSVVADRGNGLHVPFLTGLGVEVVIAWYWLDHAWDCSDPAARFTGLSKSRLRPRHRH